MRSWPAVLVISLLAGCQEPIDSPDVESEGTPDASRGATEFWMVWVEGEENRGRMTSVCDVALDHVVDPQARTVRYFEQDQTFEPSEVSALFAFDVWERDSDCPAAYALHAASTAHEETNGWGALDFQVSATGVVTGEGLTLRPGEVATLTAQRGGADVTIRVHNFGAWPQSGLLGE